MLEAGKTYTLPFNFVVPDRMLPRACPHRVQNDQVRESHLNLPPSLGEAELSGFGGKLLDDLAPEMSKIMYGIRVVISRRRERDDDDDIETVIAEKSKKIRVKPAFDEQPPIAINPASTEYSMRTEKSIRKSMLKMRSKTGRLVMESAQPPAFILPSKDPESLVSTVVRVNLRFDPADGDAEPPQLSTLQSKLKVTTFYASAPRFLFPERQNTQVDFSQGFHPETLPLSTRCMASVNWKKHVSSPSSSGSTTPEPVSPTDPSRADSYASRGSLDLTEQPAPSSSFDANKGGAYFTTQLLVPVTLPKNKHFVPTFHTCLISRTYGISLHLSLQSAKATPTQTLSLRVPVQIAQEGSPERDEARRMSQTAMEAGWEIDEVFEPRRPTIGSPDMLGRNEALGGGNDESQPPGYAVFGDTSGGQFSRAIAGVSVAA